MNKNINLLKDLLEQVNALSYHNANEDAVQKRGEMLIRKIFGNDSHYLKKLRDISYSPGIYYSGQPTSDYIESYNFGKQQLINLVKALIEDLQLDETLTNPSQKTIDTNTSNVFIVHGHNEEMKIKIARAIEKLGLNPVILHEQPNKGKTIVEKFTENSNVGFAIVLLSADDIAHKKNKPKESKYRARQNVIFELGYFIGKIGRERVLAFFENNQNLEIPSDYNGVLYVPFDKNDKWQFELVKELKACGFSVDANKLI
jgi:predicted nucleotide-binding protein